MSEMRSAAGQSNEVLSPGLAQSLVAALASEVGTERLHARERLVEAGEPAVPALVMALQSPSENVRWEAAKALGAIGDPSAAAALVDTLEDRQSGVRWLAAEALIALGRGGLVAVLDGVERCVDNYWMKEGVIHVLHTLVRDGIAPEAALVLDALEGIQPRIEAPIAAYHLLQRLGRGSG